MIDIGRAAETIRFIDIEASGLHEGSYPIEIAWADPMLGGQCFLIKPMPGWGERDWSYESERVHGIPRARLLAEGIDAVEAAERLNAALRGKEVYSDAPNYDGMWLWRLFNDTKVRPLFTLEHEFSLLIGFMDGPEALDIELIDDLRSKVAKRYPHTHRADADALLMAASWRCLADPEWRRREGFGN